MGYGSGIGGQWGILTESVVNTPVAVTTFTEILNEGIERRPNKVQSMGLHAGGLPDGVCLLRFDDGAI